MTDTSNPQDIAESHLFSALAADPNDWENRKKLAQLLYSDGKTAEAADIIWAAPELPSIDLELGFAIKILSKGAPRRSIRLIYEIQKLNKNKPVQNLGLANALMHYGMVMQAARFYGAVMAEDDSFASADLEHFLLWTDDKEKIWGDFQDQKPDLGALPWIKRDAKEAELLMKAMAGHTTPIKIPNLEEVTAETVVHEMYVQSNQVNAEPTPPPSVTIPMDRVNPKDVLVDPLRGAGQQVAPEQAAQAAPATGTSSGQPLPSPQQENPNPQQEVEAQAPIPIPEPAPTQMMHGAATRPSPLSTQALRDAPAPVMRPAQTQMLSDGKIVVNKPKPKE